MNFEEMETRIYPWIKKSEQGSLEDASQEIAVGMPIKDFLADLHIFFVADVGDHFKFLQWKDMPEGMTVDALYGIAVKNLADNIEFQLTPTNLGYYGILAGGDHEAGALCLEFLWEFCANHVGENLIVAVPAKDIVMFVGTSQAEALEEMKRMSAEILAGGNRVLTGHLFFYDREKKEFSVYE